MALANPLLVSAQADQEFKPCTGPACNPSHRNHHKDTKFIPHKKKQANIKHIRKQQIAKARQFNSIQKKRQRYQQKIQAIKQKNPRKFHKVLDKAQNPYRTKRYKPKSLDNVTFRNSNKVRRRGLDQVSVPTYRFKHRSLDNKKFSGNYKLKHYSLDSRKYSGYQQKHRNLDNRKYTSYQHKHKSLDKRRYIAYQQKHRNLDSRRYSSYQQKHHQRDQKRMQSYVVRHKPMDRKRMSSYYVRHKNLDNRRIYVKKQKDREPAFKVDKPARVTKQYAQKIRKGIVVIPSATYVMLNRNPKNFKTMKHKQYDGVTMPRYRITHKGLDSVTSQKLKIKHKNLDYATMPKYRQKRNNPHQFCYPKLVVPHKNLDGVCYPKLVVPHRQLDHLCYPKLIIPHKQLDLACGLKPYRIKHKQLDLACGLKPYRIKHKQLDLACGERPYRVRHKQLDNVCYKDFKMCHRPLEKYKVPCDPNIVQPKSNLERVGEDLKYFFTNKKRFCKLNSIYSGVSAGKIVETQKYGKGVVTDYIIKNRLIQYVRYVNGDSTKIKVKYRKSPSIKHLVVLVPRDDKHIRKSNGDPNLKKVKLSQKETKEIMMKHLIEKRNFVWLIRMYPEEEQNLPELYAKYGGYMEVKHPAFQKK